MELTVTSFLLTIFRMCRKHTINKYETVGGGGVIAEKRAFQDFFVRIVLINLSAKTGLDSLGRLNGVDVGVEVFVVRDRLPLDERVGQGERFTEVLSGESREEIGIDPIGELVFGQTPLATSVVTISLGLSVIPGLGDTSTKLEPSDFVELGAVDVVGGHVLRTTNPFLVLHQLREPVKDVGLGHLLFFIIITFLFGLFPTCFGYAVI